MIGRDTSETDHSDPRGPQDIPEIRARLYQFHGDELVQSSGVRPMEAGKGQQECRQRLVSSEREGFCGQVTASPHLGYLDVPLTVEKLILPRL